MPIPGVGSFGGPTFETDEELLPVTTEAFQWETDHARRQYVFFMTCDDFKLMYPWHHIPDMFLFVSEKTGKRVEMEYDRQSKDHVGNTIHHYRGIQLASGWDIVIQLLEYATKPALTLDANWRKDNNF